MAEIKSFTRPLKYIQYLGSKTLDIGASGTITHNTNRTYDGFIVTVNTDYNSTSQWPGEVNEVKVTAYNNNTVTLMHNPSATLQVLAKVWGIYNNGF